MRKIFCLLSLASLFTAFVSCDSDTYRHNTSIVYPYGVKTLFADQTQDSVLFTTFDSYKVTTNNTPWMRVLTSEKYPSSATIPNSYYTSYMCGVKVQAEPNTSDKCRMGYIDVHSFGQDWDQTVSAGYYQLCWHNVMHPAPDFTRDASGNVIGCKYEQVDSFNCVVDTLRFQAFDKWTLSVPEGSFVMPKITSGDAGYHTLILSVSRNEGSSTRSTQLTLKSDNGAQTIVGFKQKAKGEKASL